MVLCALPLPVFVFVRATQVFIKSLNIHANIWIIMLLFMSIIWYSWLLGIHNKFILKWQKIYYVLALNTSETSWFELIFWRIKCNSLLYIFQNGVRKGTIRWFRMSSNDLSIAPNVKTTLSWLIGLWLKEKMCLTFAPPCIKVLFWIIPIFRRVQIMFVKVVGIWFFAMDKQPGILWGWY